MSNRFIPGLFNSLLDTLLPRTCVHCKRNLLPDEKVLCTGCFANIESASAAAVNHEYISSFQHTSIDRFYSPFIFRRDSAIQSLIHSFKYYGLYKNAEYSGGILGDRILNAPGCGKFDIVIPVPLHKLKRLERGYNQSDWICRGLVNKIDIPVDKGSIIRRVHTKSQTFLNREERIENMKEAFSDRRPERVKGKNVLLVDDVKTTGTTLIECANAVKNAGAAEITAVTLAIAAPGND